MNKKIKISVVNKLLKSGDRKVYVRSIIAEVDGKPWKENHAGNQSTLMMGFQTDDKFIECFIEPSAMCVFDE